MGARVTKWSGRLASLLLIAAAIFHMTGLPMVEQAANSIAPPFLAASLGPLWVFASLNWTGFALIGWWLAEPGRVPACRVLACIGVCLIGQAGLLFLAVGGFIGAIVLGVSGLLYVVAAMSQWRLAAID